MNKDKKYPQTSPSPINVLNTMKAICIGYSLFLEQDIISKLEIGTHLETSGA